MFRWLKIIITGWFCIRLQKLFKFTFKLDEFINYQNFQVGYKSTWYSAGKYLPKQNISSFSDWELFLV